MNFKNVVTEDGDKYKKPAYRLDFLVTQADIDREYERIKRERRNDKNHVSITCFKNTANRKSNAYSFFNHTDVDFSLEEVSKGIGMVEKELQAVCSEAEVCLNDYLRKALLTYYKLLVEWNEKINLTALTKSEDVYYKHFIDSAKVIPYLKSFTTVLDVGSGAGFPGLIIAIFRPDLSIILVDSLQKRVDFLNHVIKTLKLNNVKAVHNRVEDNDFKKEHLNSFNYVVSRAVASLDTLSEYCIPFVKIGGEFIAFKADNVDEELKHSLVAMRVMGGIYEKTEEYVVNSVVRKLIFVKKIKTTKDKYPRGLNKPKSSPVK